MKTREMAALLVAGSLFAACGSYRSDGTDTVTFSGSGEIDSGESGSSVPNQVAQPLNGGDYDVRWSVQPNPDHGSCDFIATLVHRPERPDRSYATESTELVRANVFNTAASGTRTIYGIAGGDYVVNTPDSACGPWQVTLASR